MEDTLIDIELLDLETAMSRGRFDGILNGAEPWTHLVTSGNNNLLHIVANSGEASRFRSLLTNPSYVSIALLRKNKRGETPLHCASRRGNISFLDIFISNMSDIAGKKMMLLKIKNKQGDTALHLATRNNHFEVVDRIMNENVHLGSMANNSGECPLYIAAFKGFREIAERLVETSAIGPGKMTALHAASCQIHLDVVELLLDKRPELCRERDEKGSTPLFCVASIRRHMYKEAQPRIKKIVQALVAKDISSVLLSDENGASVLHVAAGIGHIDVLHEILKRRRDFLELVDNTGKTFLHVAVEFKKEKVVRYVLKELIGVEELLNQPDDEGNTPLHLAVHVSDQKIVRMLLKDKRVVLDSINQKGNTPFDLAFSVYWENPRKQLRMGMIFHDLKYFGMKFSSEKLDLVEDKRRMNIIMVDREKYRRAVSNTMVIVAVLIATITFAAGVTLPGGYKNDAGPEQGTASLTKSIAFKVFLISDTLAMITAILVISFLFQMESRYHDVSLRSFQVSTVLLQISFTEMFVAFATGVYAVISEECLWLAILILLIIGILPLALYTDVFWAYRVNPYRKLVFSRMFERKK